MKFYKNIELSADVIYINNMLFIISISNNIHYRIISAIANLKCSLLESELQSVVRSYAIRSFKIILIGVDIQFKTLKDQNLVGIPINIVARDKYVPKIE